MIPERLRFGLRRLYELRLDVDYDGTSISRVSAAAGLQTVHHLLVEIDQRTSGEHRCVRYILRRNG